jgi:leucyl aminopeptidase
VVRFEASNARPSDAKADLVAIAVWEGKVPAGHTSLERSLARLCREDRFRGKAGETLLYHAGDDAPSSRYLVVGMGPESKGGLDSLRVASASVSRRAAALAARAVAVTVPGGTRLRRNPADSLAGAIVEGFLLGGYRFDRYRSRDDAAAQVERVRILTGHHPARKIRAGIRRGEHYAEATNFARNLVTEPPSRMTPLEMASIARAEARRTGLQCKVMRRAELERRNMGGLLGVARGSVEEPCFIHLTYRPKGRVRRKVALVGKGITFDSGGLSLKTASGMETMKMDMAGAAAVLAVMRTLGSLRIPLQVDGLMAMTENLPSGSAQKPGDVLRTFSGKTVEVTNTDAEGRLVLADALAYAVRMGPDQIIDLATLTGACVVALGPAAAGILGTDQKLVDALLIAAGRAGERAWQLPLFDEYLEMMRSPVADLKNSGPRWGGALTAALFLREFVDPKIPWAHLDIAGPAFLDRPHSVFPKGATGAGVRTLLHHLEAQP